MLSLVGDADVVRIGVGKVVVGVLGALSLVGAAGVVGWLDVAMIGLP